MIRNTKIGISDPKIDQVVFFKPWQGKDTKKKAYPVIINSGQYMTEHGLSNFWYWQKISPTVGRISKNIEHGYGKFTLAKGYSVKIINMTLVLEETISKVIRKVTIF